MPTKITRSGEIIHLPYPKARRRRKTQHPAGAAVTPPTPGFAESVYTRWGNLLLEKKKKKGKKWIQKAVKHPGRCTPMPNPDCPVGSPQYNLGKRFKKAARKKKKKGGSGWQGKV